MSCKQVNDVSVDVAQQKYRNNKYYISTFRYIYIYIYIYIEQMFGIALIKRTFRFDEKMQVKEKYKM